LIVTAAEAPAALLAAANNSRSCFCRGRLYHQTKGRRNNNNNNNNNNQIGRRL
jgi:hypothetical protein